MFNRIVFSIVLFDIVGSTYPNIAEAFSNEQLCQDVVKQKLAETDFGSEAANKPLIRKTIALVAQKDVMNIVKLSNRGELNSLEDRQKEIKKRLEQKKVFNFVTDFDEVSYQAADKIELLLENECKGVK